jgi:pimeloyl-ACP methyl ester carboxylesterase
MAYADINGARMYYETAGAGETVALLHAGIADRRMWDAQVEVLAQHYRVIRYDLRGYGQTTAPAMTYSHVDDLRALLAHLGVERTALIGCSKGGTVALDYLLTYPDMATALVMVCSSPGGFPFEGEPPPLIQALIAAREAHDLEKMAELATQLWGVGANRAPERVDAGFRALVYEMTLIGFRNQAAGLGKEQEIAPSAVGRLGEVRMPTLVIDGAEDEPATHQAGEFMAEQTAGARRVVMPDAAHLPSLEHPDAFNRILLDFLTASI